MQFKHIRSRIALLTSAVTILSLGISWLINFVYFSGTIRDQVIHDNQAIAEKAADRINNDLEYVKYYANTISYDQTLLPLLSQYYEKDGFKKFSVENELRKLISNYDILSKGIIYNIYVADANGTDAITSRGMQNILLKESWFTQLREPCNGFTPLHSTINLSMSHLRQDTISFAKTLGEYGEAKLGTLIVDLDLKKIFPDMQSLEENLPSYYLVSKDRKKVYGLDSASTSAFTALDFSQEVQLLGDSYYLSTYIPLLDNYLVSVVPKQFMDDALRGSTVVLFLSLLCGLFITGIFVLFLSKSITRPIVRLSDSMKKSVRENFTLEVAPRGKDELSDMTIIFNNMQQETRELMEINRAMEKNERDLRMKYFMSKINPHFIYNTLNCVIYLARKNQSKQIISLTRALIAILKTNIALGENPIPIQNEIDYLTHYFEILRYRYNDEIRIAFDIPENLRDLHIQPMILYPLVENSVFHGIVPSGHSGTVLVRIFERDEHIFFSVSDDGIGIGDDKKQEILHYIHSENGCNIYGSIGLKNVNDRLQLFYPSCMGLEVESAQKTTIGFVIDKKDLKDI
ncbi:MAG: histidine kinase [Oscillospiraceae bacterium]